MIYRKLKVVLARLRAHYGLAAPKEEPVATKNDPREWMARWQMLKKNPVKLIAWLKTYRWGGGRIKEMPNNLRVRCHGKIHIVDITPGGRIRMHGHPKAEMDAMKMLITMGAQPPRCFDIVGVLTGKASKWNAEDKLPQELKAYSRALRYIRQRRQVEKQVIPPPSLKQRVASWLVNSVDHMVGRIIVTGIEGANRVIVGLGEPGAQALPDAGVDMKGRLVFENSGLAARVPRSWVHWHDNGLGVIDRHLIIDVRRNRARVRVLAVRVEKARAVAEWRYAAKLTFPDGVKRWVLQEAVPKMEV